MAGPLNTEYFTSLIAQINLCSSCAELQAVVTQAMDSINEQLAGITTAVGEFEALQVLLEGPAANPDAIVTWITNLITLYLGPQLAAYAKYVAQLAALTAEVAVLTAAITAAASNFESCTVEIPAP
jgi:hypothetical protein